MSPTRYRLLVSIAALLVFSALIPPLQASPAADPLAVEAFATSLALDGVTDYVEIPSAPALTPTSGMTIEAWVMRNDANRCETIVGKDFTTAYWLGFCPKPRFYAGGSTSIDGATTVPAGVWTHVAAVWQSGGSRLLYINGELDGSNLAGSAPSATGVPLIIGADGSSLPTPGYEFSGKIAEVRLWNVSRTQDEIRRTMHVALDNPLPGLVGSWHLSDDVRDHVGSHHGTLRGNAALTGPAAPPRPALVPVDEAFNTLPASRYAAGAAFVPGMNELFLAGGIRSGSASPLVEAVNINTGASRLVATLPAARTAAAAVYVPTRNTIYLFGGSSDIGGTSVAQTIYAIDGTTGALRTLPATLPSARRSLAAVYHPTLNQVYLFGGVPAGGGAALTEILRFDPVTESFLPLSGMSLPSGQANLAAAYSTARDAIFLFGGSAADESSVSSAIIRVALSEDGASGTVTPLPTGLPTPTQGASVVEDPQSRLLYLLTGSGTAQVMAFDPASEAVWMTPMALSAARRGAVAVYHPTRREALVFGGYTSSARSEVVRVPLGNGPAIALGRWDFPASVGTLVTSIAGDERQVLVGTWGNGVYRYSANGTRTQYSAGTLSSATGRVNDVAYHALTDDSWVGTDDAGAKVIRTDGTILTYGSSRLGTNRVLSISLHPGYTSLAPFPGFLGTDQGLKWEPASVFTTVFRTNFSGSYIKGVAHRDPGDVWVVRGESLARMTYTFAGGGVESDFGYPCNLVGAESLAFSRNRDWWIGHPTNIESGYGSGICRLLAGTTPGTGNAIAPAVGYIATDVSVDSDDRVWFSVGGNGAETGGLVAYETVGTPATLRTSEWNWLKGPLGSRTLVGYSPPQQWQSRVTAVGAADERVWTGNDTGRLVTLAQRWQQLDESNNLDTTVIERLWLVRGRAFLASANGLHILAPDGKQWDNRTGLQTRVVFGDSRGQTWVGTDSDLRRYLPSGWDMLAGTVGTPPVAPIQALAEDRDGRLWIGGTGGLTLFDRERWVATFTTANSGLPANNVKALLVDNDNRLWVGTANGLARFDGTTWTRFSTTDGLPANAIHDLAQTGDSRIAISTAAGLSFYNGTTFATDNPPLDTTANLPLTVDEQGRLWAGSAVRTGGGWQGYYPTNSGLRASTVSDNAADGADRVWFSHAPAPGVSLRGTLLPPLAETVPTIASISPDVGRAGDLITILGSGFGADPADVDVTIGQAPVIVESLTPTSIVVRLNANNRSGEVAVRVGRRRTAVNGSGRPAFCAQPVISSFTPTGGNDGVLVTITGTNFDSGATVFMGGATPRTAGADSPTQLRLFIQPGDGNGSLRVRNPNAGCPTSDAVGSVPFQRIGLTVTALDMNQGMSAYGLIADRPTLLSSFLQHSVAPRTTDRLEVDTVEVTLTDGAGTTATRRLPYAGAIPTTAGPPSDVLRRDILNSVNATVEPTLPGFTNGTLTINVALRRNGVVVAQRSQSATFQRNQVLRILLIPIMPEGYTLAQLNAMKANVEGQLANLRKRILPTGTADLRWSHIVLTRGGTVALDDVLELYNTSHDMEGVRRRWNDLSDEDALIAFGVLDGSLVTGNVAGYGFWPDASQLLNMLVLNWVDLLCDVGNAVVQVLTLGFVGSDDGCHLEVPLYVGWAKGDGSSISQLFGHEFGHIMGLVKPWAANGSAGDNFSHSVNDELDGGECGGAGTTFNDNKTLYRQPGVTEPVVNPLTGVQYRPQLDGNSGTARGKAIMSYACGDGNDNVFYEPVDVSAFRAEFGLSSTRGFIEEVTPLTQLGALAAQPSEDPLPSPRPLSGQRLAISGTVNRTSSSGDLMRVESVGNEAPLSASFASGYWIVQRDASGNELIRTGLYPLFATVGEGDTAAGPQQSDTGFFSATLLRWPGAVRLELRHNETLLDSFQAGGAAPVVTISSPTGGTFNTGTILVGWNATDANGDALTIAVDYSADGLTWLPVGRRTGSGPGSLTIPVAILAGSPTGRIRVTASDGFNTGSALSPAITIAAQPPQPVILQPGAGATVAEGEAITLMGRGDDNRDGTVAETGLQWRSNRDGLLGTGASLPVQLSVGVHTLTLQATNSAGLSAVATTQVTITGDYDFDGIADSAELTSGLNPLAGHDALTDSDGDGLILVVERERGTNPASGDSDGDGRGDAAEVTAGTNPAASDAPLPPNTLAAFPASLSFSANLALDTPLPQQLIEITSRAPVSWTVTADAPWIALSDASGQTPAGTTVLVQAYELTAGTHTTTLRFTSPALGQSVVVPVTVTVTNRAAYFDSTGDGKVTIVDVQRITSRFGTNNEDPSFNYRRDLNRDGRMDVRDALLIAQQWVP